VQRAESTVPQQHHSSCTATTTALSTAGVPHGHCKHGSRSCQGPAACILPTQAEPVQSQPSRQVHANPAASSGASTQPVTSGRPAQGLLAQPTGPGPAQAPPVAGLRVSVRHSRSSGQHTIHQALLRTACHAVQARPRRTVTAPRHPCMHPATQSQGHPQHYRLEAAYATRPRVRAPLQLLQGATPPVAAWLPEQRQQPGRVPPARGPQGTVSRAGQWSTSHAR